MCRGVLPAPWAGGPCLPSPLQVSASTFRYTYALTCAHTHVPTQARTHTLTCPVLQEASLSSPQLPLQPRLAPPFLNPAQWGPEPVTGTEEAFWNTPRLSPFEWTPHFLCHSQTPHSLARSLSPDAAALLLCASHGQVFRESRSRAPHPASSGPRRVGRWRNRNLLRVPAAC